MSLQLKKCNTCTVEKGLDQYNNNKRYNDGKESKCRDCMKAYLSGKKDKSKEAQRKWREKNPDYMKNYGKSEKSKEYHKQYYAEHSQEYKDRKKQWRIENPEKEIAARKNYKINNSEKLNKYHSQWKCDKRKTDVNYKLKENISRRIRYELYSLNKGKKTKRSLEYVGCEPEQLKAHLESKFTSEMNWDNYGKLWHIDHIIPCAAWNLTNEFENMCCWNYRNLQPMLSSDNQSKKDKYEPSDKETYVHTMNIILSKD